MPECTAFHQFLTLRAIPIYNYKIIIKAIPVEAKVIHIGTSKGIRIPAALLKELGDPSAFDIVENHNKIILKPLKKPRDGWEKAFALMHRNGDDAIEDDMMDAELIDV